MEMFGLFLAPVGHRTCDKESNISVMKPLWERMTKSFSFSCNPSNGLRTKYKIHLKWYLKVFFNIWSYPTALVPKTTQSHALRVPYHNFSHEMVLSLMGRNESHLSLMCNHSLHDECFILYFHFFGMYNTWQWELMWLTREWLILKEAIRDSDSMVMLMSRNR